MITKILPVGTPKFGKVLIVEDNDSYYADLARLVKTVRPDAHITRAATMPQAINAFKKIEGFDRVLLDEYMNEKGRDEDSVLFRILRPTLRGNNPPALDIDKFLFTSSCDYSNKLNGATV